MVKDEWICRDGGYQTGGVNGQQALL